jgi:hypothetical protein
MSDKNQQQVGGVLYKWAAAAEWGLVATAFAAASRNLHLRAAWRGLGDLAAPRSRFAPAPYVSFAGSGVRRGDGAQEALAFGKK